jgi:hypothetical protein
MKLQKARAWQLQEARDWLDCLAYQRENNAVVSLDLQDCRAIRTVLAELDELCAEENKDGK